jgi:outer membrane protein assembly factor BamE
MAMKGKMAILLASAVACGCATGPFSAHKPEMRQGNVWSLESGGGLRTGMSRAQVRYLMGTPMLVDPFHRDRWDYVHLFRPSDGLTVKRLVTVHFADGKVERIERR